MITTNAISKSSLRRSTYVTALLLLLCVFSLSSVQAEGILLSYESATHPNDIKIKKRLQKTVLLHKSIDFLNDHFILPETLHVNFGGEDGPLYDPQTKEILIPYVFLEEIEQRFRKDNYEKTGVSIEEATTDALIHTLFHEFAHAIIDMHNLPVLGKEEDAADSLAVYLLIEHFDNGGEMAISAADLFDLESDDTNILTDEDFWGEHSLDDQRYFSTLCQVYGSQPKEYDYIVKEALLSEERADLCIEEYDQIANSWFRLLVPFTKKPS